jgi:hypothetical protein
MMQVRTMDRAVLAEMFPRRAEDIWNREKVPRVAADEGPNVDALADQVKCVEAWRLPSYPGATDGAHAIATGAVLLSDPKDIWMSTRFPFQRMTWELPRTGYWGRSLVEQVTGVQLENNEMGVKVSRILYKLGVPYILTDRNSKVEKGHFNNSMEGVVIDYEGTPPQVVAHTAVSPELFGQQDRTRAQIYQLSGVSELDAGGQKPAGIDSGKGLRVYSEISKGRLGIEAQRYERGSVDLGRLIIDSARRLHDSGASVEVTAEAQRRRSSFLVRIKWADVDMDDDAFQLKVFPANALSSHPSAKLADIQELIGSGMLDRTTALSLIDFPDLDATVALETAPRDLILDILDRIVEDDEVIPPEPGIDLAMALRLGALRYNRARLDGADDAALSRLRDWALQVQALIPKPPPEQPLPEQPPPGAPAGQPGIPDATLPV